MEDACRNKRCPQLTQCSMHFNWSKIFGPNGDASKQLFDYYSGVYELAPEQREKEETAKTKCVAEWQSDLETGAQPLHFSVETLRKIINKLKPGKGSSDGITAETLRELDESNLEAMAAALNTANSRKPGARSQPHWFQSWQSRLDPKISGQSQHWSLSENWWDTCSCTLLRHHLGTHSSVGSSQAETHPKQSSVSRGWEKWQRSGSDTCTEHSWTCRRPSIRSTTAPFWQRWTEFKPAHSSKRLQQTCQNKAQSA